MAQIEQISKRAGNMGQHKVTLAAAVGLVSLVIILGFFWTGIDSVEPGKAAVIVKNLTGRKMAQTEPGYILHMPFNITEVYQYVTEDRILKMEGKLNGGPMGSDSIQIKTRDGSNVDIDAEIKYRVMKEDAALITLADSFGRDADSAIIEDLIRSFGRSVIREVLGEMFIQDMTEASQRQAKAIVIKDKMSEELKAFGVAVDTVSVRNMNLNDEYEAMIRDRKDADQQFTNQASAQKAAEQEKARQIAQATREKNTAVEEERGRQQKRTIEAQGRAVQMRTRADGEAAKVRVEGKRAFEVAANEAKAIEAEGLAKAEGILKLSEAYQHGGMALVRESLAEKYRASVINGRPYSLSSDVERVAIEPAPPSLGTAGAAAVRATAGQGAR